MDAYLQNREINEKDFLKNEEIRVNVYDINEKHYYKYLISPLQNGKVKLVTYKELPNKEMVMEDKKIATKTDDANSIINFINAIIKNKREYEDLVMIFIPKGYKTEQEKLFEEAMERYKKMGQLKGHKTTISTKKSNISQLENSVRKMF